MSHGASRGTGRARVLLVGQDTSRRRRGLFPGHPRVSPQGPRAPVHVHGGDDVHLHGLLLFFVQTLATFEEGMSKLGLVSAAMATAAVLIFISVSIMLMMFGITAAKMSSSVKHVVALGEAIVAPMWGSSTGATFRSWRSRCTPWTRSAEPSAWESAPSRVNAGERILLYRHAHLHQRGAPVVPPVVLESDGFRQRHRVDRVGPALPDRTRVARARRSDAGAPGGRRRILDEKDS